MKIKLSGLVSRLLLVFFAAFSAVFLSYYSIRDALAAHYAKLETREGLERAVRLEPENPEYWHLLGRYLHYNLPEADLPRAIQAYNKSISLNPRSADTWLDLAAAYEQQGDFGAAQGAFLRAKDVYPASAEVLWRYGTFLLRQKELDAAFAEIRHAVEQDPGRGAEAFVQCWHSDPNFDDVLKRALPPLPKVYLAVIWTLINDRHADLALRVWPKLLPLRPQLTKLAAFHFVEGLAASGRAAEAQEVWRQAVDLMGIPPPQDPAGSVVWDGGFETDLYGGGLGWRFGNSAKSQVGFDQNEKHSDKRSLVIQVYDDDRAPFGGVCQTAVANPGIDYELSAWFRTAELGPGRGITIQLGALSASGNRSASTSEVLGTTAWSRVAVVWSQPKDNAFVQVCVQLAPNARFSERTTGAVWVDDVSLIPITQHLDVPRQTHP